MQEWGTASRVWIPRHHGPGEHNYESAISFPELDSKCLPCPPKPGNGRSGLSFHVLALQNIPTLWKPAVEGKCNFSDMRVPSKGSCTHSFIPGLFRAKQALDCQAREAVLPLPWMTSGVPVRCWETRPGKLCPHFHGWRPKGWPSPGAPGLVSCATFSMGQPVSGMSGLGTFLLFCGWSSQGQQVPVVPGWGNVIPSSTASIFRVGQPLQCPFREAEHSLPQIPTQSGQALVYQGREAVPPLLQLASLGPF